MDGPLSANPEARKTSTTIGDKLKNIAIGLQPSESSSFPENIHDDVDAS
jgi:hypothetical protein